MVIGASRPAFPPTPVVGGQFVSEGPSLLEELGLDESTLSWHQLALCGGRQTNEEGMELNWFFDDYESDAELAKTMDEVCLKCPVMRDCLMEGTDGKNYGLWGGIYLDNGKQDKARNAHKTPEVWARIQEKIRNE